MKEKHQLPILFVVIALAILMGGLNFYFSQKEDLRKAAEDELYAIARLKVSQITAWRAERLGDAHVLMDNPLFSEVFEDVLTSADPDVQTYISSQFQSLAEHYRYVNVYLTDAEGELIFGLSADNVEPPVYLAPILAGAFNAGRPILTDLHPGSNQQPPHMHVIMPVLSQENKRPLGGVIFEIDARQYLFPLVQTWPTASKTAETLIGRREGDEVIYLNDLRHREIAAFEMQRPLSDRELPLVQAVQGKEGLFQGRDYRGEEVLAVVLPVPGTPWFMISKMDVSEAMSVMRRESNLTLAFILALVLFTGAIGMVVIQRNEKDYYKHLFQLTAGQKKAEEALRQSEEKHRLLAENTLDVIWTLNWDLKFTYVNPAVKRLTGHEPEEWIGRHLREFCDDNNYRLLTGLISQELAKGDTPDGLIFEAEILDKQGASVPVEVNGKIIFDADGTPVALQGVTRDIRERRRAQEEKEKLQDQLLQARKMESVGRLAGGIAHDFNNMLNVILGYAELAIGDLSPSHPIRPNLEAIRDSAKRSADLTGQLLAFARKQTASPVVLILNKEIESLLVMLRRLIGENIELTWLPSDHPWNVKIDPIQLNQILANLAVNARDAIEGVGEITIETQNIAIPETSASGEPSIPPGDYVKLSVSDTGRGMDRDVLEHIFEPFYTTKSIGQGTGLGLATVHGIVQQNEGYIHAESRRGKGARITIHFRREIAEVPERPDEPSRKCPPGGGETVLLVEDEEGILALGKLMLEQLGYQVVAANTPRQALEIPHETIQKVGLLITDVVMPGMNGKQLSERLTGMNKNLKTLYMSGYPADVVSLDDLLDANALLIQKPFSLKKLSYLTRLALDGEIGNNNP